jgi:hypothetical protein
MKNGRKRVGFDYEGPAARGRTVIDLTHVLLPMHTGEDERRKVDVTSINCIAATAQLQYSSIVKSEVSDNPIKLQEEDMILYKHRADSRY